MARRVSFMERGLSQSRISANRPSLVPRSMLGIQHELDLQDFDASMGCPLSSYEEATLALVGGKALQCWRLMKYGLPVPPSFIIPTYVYSVHVGHAGVGSLIEEIYNSNLLDEKVREASKEKLAKVHDAILATALPDEVIDNIEIFVETMPGTNTFAVRSSGSAEDLASQSFAGQYDTFLYKSTADEIAESVKKCWASMFKSHILDYVASAAALGKSDIYTPENMKAPKMAVLIMKMVDAKAAGVCFSRNLWGEIDEVMIEAVPGQGEGLVGGEITPDRYVLNKYTGKLVYQTIETQTHKFAQAKNVEGVEKVELDAPLDQPVLTKENLKKINVVARTIESFYNQAQDIEWAIDHEGNLNVLQSRPITTTSKNTLSFVPPGEGFWTFDPVHYPRPVTPWLQACYGFDHGVYHSRRLGSMIRSVNMRFVHQFVFTQPVIVPPSDALERAAAAYWSKKLYEDDYREFTDFFRPECEAMHDDLRKVNPSGMSHSSLASYVAKCFDMAREFWKLHHRYTFPAMVVVGDYMNQMAALTGKDPLETLELLEGTSPESRGLLNRKDPLLDKMYTLLTSSEQAMELLQNKSDPQWALDCLLHMPNELGDVMREVRLKYGWRLAGGYDLVVPALIETPGFFLQTLYNGTQEDPKKAEKAEAKVRKTADEWKAAVPEDKHEEFEEVLKIGQMFFRLRDERGLATDLSGIGLCRRGIMEAGRRLVDLGILKVPGHLCVATKEEAMSLLRGSGSNGMGLGVVEIPTAEELEKRYNYIIEADPNLIPRALGTPPPPPDASQLPPNIARTMAALNVSLLRGIWDEGQENADEDIMKSTDKVKGIGACMGQITGPVCLVLNDGDLSKVKKGDIVCTYSCSASFNVVLGICSGIVTDYGGMLSHAAIVSREYGIPAVVGSQQATAKFKDGDTITVDGGTGIVSLVSRKSS